MKLKNKACHNCIQSKYHNFKFYCLLRKIYINAHDVCNQYRRFT
jgi:hypothetical protein